MNAIGQGLFAITDNPTMIGDPVSTPETPTHLKATGVTSNYVSLKWAEPCNLGNLPLKTYIVELVVNGDDNKWEKYKNSTFNLFIW